MNDIAQLFEIRNGEVWRIYSLTRTGNSRSIIPKRADSERKDGYREVSVRQRKILAHRLIWTVLKGAIPDGFEINHKNGNRGDNRIENLEIVTMSENILHSYSNLNRPRLCGTKNGRSKLMAEQISIIRTCCLPSRVLARQYGVSKTTINRIRNRQRWAHILNEVPE